MYQKIVVALDGSETAEAVLPHVVPLAQKFGGTVTLVRARTPMIAVVGAMDGGAVPGAPTDPTPILDAEAEDIEKYLASVAAQLSKQGVRVEQADPEGPAAAAVVDYAREAGADLIALTTHGRGGLERAVFGSVADSVLRHTPCPVLLVRVYHDQPQA